MFKCKCYQIFLRKCIIICHNFNSATVSIMCGFPWGMTIWILLIFVSVYHSSSATTESSDLSVSQIQATGKVRNILSDNLNKYIYHPKHLHVGGSSFYKKNENKNYHDHIISVEYTQPLIGRKCRCILC